MVPLVYAVIRARVIDSHQSRLDHGGGKDLSLPECPRERLEKEVQFRFISAAHDVNGRIAGLHREENYVSEIRPLCHHPFLIRLP